MSDDTLTPVWKALSDPTRRGILDLLRGGPRTTGALAAAVEESSGLSRFAVMKHLGILEAAGLVLVRRKGRERWNYLNAVPLRRIYERWVSDYASECASSMLRLQDTAQVPENDIGGAKKMNRVEMEQEVLVGAEPERVFDALTTRVGDWWTHTFSDSPKAVRLEPQIGGRFFEEYGDVDGGVLYATVTHLKRGQHLELAGPMGMQGVVMGLTRFDLEARDGSTLVKLSHQAIGDVDEAMEQSYAAGWKAILEKQLKGYLEG
jgi:DNA-binding transcriptional ArsR family regulator/uncharacterized protein YndB with AHSA1/START domain